MVYLRWLLLPFSGLYGAVVWLRNRFYDRGWLPQASFEKPIIVVGNLEAGGTGKTPMTEFLIRLLAERYRLATLSRGYGRRTNGFREVYEDSVAGDVGDEPLQFKRKFPQITVAVDADRVAGVSQLVGSQDLILLDDAFQHRALKPGFSILLFDYNSLEQPHFLLPAGNFRDFFSERKRADLLIVTKCPADLDRERRLSIEKQLQSGLTHKRKQPVLFAGVGYEAPQAVFSADPAILEATPSILLLTGIAKPRPLLAFVKTQTSHSDHLAFPDHHRFSAGDMDFIRRKFDALPGAVGQKLILTTEKDARRLETSPFSAKIRDLPVFYLPMQFVFDSADQQVLEETILSYCASVLTRA